MKIGVLNAGLRQFAAEFGERAARAGRGLAGMFRRAANVAEAAPRRSAAAIEQGWQRFSARFLGARGADKPAPTTLTRGGAARSPLSPGDVKAMIRSRLDSLRDGMADPVYRRQALESTYATIYSEAKQAFYRANGGKMPEGYLRELGEAARAAGLPGENKHGVFIPSGDGASPFVNYLLIPVQKEFGHRLRNESQQRLFRDFARQLSMELVAPHAAERGWEPPAAFAARLEAVGRPWLAQA
ncbi:Guanine nucleotide exchange factor BopE [Chromobacterium violaceum]|uniref:Guanine nucleotide exchange factor n=1 Tax=Chromobacterium violaceum (strain ATCC 12472 / DSM 30191 / JCM 1249 / CCUG 213 / NBRC 12614 / NCIMB 9131 / NCTC 9757 / MK) TaxID=243365 RepID=Q7P1B7_CHRVO|nr:hypothetical protein [Chromobacterium violaceum]AAQ57975.1 conserved hypothetical protein [Chromobacterium violaceum ATCC 12472]SUX40438.1 Toxin sopE2 [Chromobacterium violaceum]